MDPLLLVSIIALLFGAVSAAFLGIYPRTGSPPWSFPVFLALGFICGDLMKVAFVPSIVFLVAVILRVHMCIPRVAFISHRQRTKLILQPREENILAIKVFLCLLRIA